MNGAHVNINYMHTTHAHTHNAVLCIWRKNAIFINK